MAPPHAIYADEMTTLMHGYPLWEPECRPAVSIADVGYIRNGRFCRLFNASLPPDHALNEFGVPEGYEPLHLDERAMVERTLPPGPMASRSITNHTANVGVSAGSLLQAGMGFQFSCLKDRGAVLIINSEARRKDSEQRGALKRYMLKHYKSWHTFANAEPRSRDISLSDLVFVTGRDNTADWAVAAFSQRSTSGGVQFQANFPNLPGANFSIWGSWSGITSLHSNCGPQIYRRHPSELVTTPGGGPGQVCAADLGDYDQCIFIRGLRVMDRTTQFRQKIGMKVSSNSPGFELLQQPWMSRNPSTDSSRTIKGRSDTTGGSWGKNHIQSADNPALDKRDSSNDVEMVPNEAETFAPVQLLLAYILQQNSQATVAIAHDDDLATIIEKNDSLDFGVLLGKVSPPVVVDSEGVGTLSFDAPNVSSPSDPGKEHWCGSQSSVFSRDQSVDGSPLRKGSSLQTRRPSTRHYGGTAKPDSTAYEEQQECIRAKINVVQARLNELQGKLSLISKNGREAERRASLRSELDLLRDQQLASKAARDALTAEFKRSQEDIRVKIKDLQGMAKKLPAKTIDELESKKRSLDRKVEAGNMALSEEKKVVGQINSLKRSQTAVELYQLKQSQVETDREKVGRLRIELDSQPKDLSGRIEAIRAELDGLQKERDQAFANREQLFRERDELQKELSELHGQRRQAAEQFREKHNQYLQKLTEDRALEAERLRAEKNTLEEERRAEARERLLERARVPAYAAEIRDCRSLLEYFSGKADNVPVEGPSTVVVPSQPPPTQLPSNGNHPGPGWVALKKKTEEETYFVGGKGKGKKGQRRGTPSSATASSKISIPLGIMHTLSSLAIAPPTTTADIPMAIEEIKKKIDWFEADQTTATEENVARVEAELNRIGYVPRAIGRSVTA